jgi:hypothetical protein
MTRTRKYLAVTGAALAIAGGAFAGGYVAHSTPAPQLTACPAPALAGQHAGYVTSGSRIIGINGSNGLAPGDVYTCDHGQGSIN